MTIETKINTNKPKWDEAYSLKGETLPWCLGTIPEWFKKIIESEEFLPNKNKPYTALDIACGNGDYAAYLQTLENKKFNVTAVDYSTKILEIARKKHEGLGILFEESDVLDLSKLNKKYDLAYGISILHHINPEQRDNFAKSIYSVLNKNGKSIICCFSDKEPNFEGKKEFVDPNTGTLLYPISREILTETFNPYFKIEKIDEIIYGRSEYKIRNICIMEKSN